VFATLGALHETHDCIEQYCVFRNTVMQRTLAGFRTIATPGATPVLSAIALARTPDRGVCEACAERRHDNKMRDA
jgi:hypothetical protein